MRIFMACPAPPRSLKGNRVTAVRWAGILRRLGHRLTIGQDYNGTPCDVLVALHARKSHDAVRAYRRLHPHGPLIVALTGTDLYHDLRTSRQALRSLDLADRLVLLQPCGRDALPPHVRAKTRVIFQSAEPSRSRPERSQLFFDVCVLGHLRYEKDPFRTALALRHLPHDSRIRVTHAGQALSAAMAAHARALTANEPRYRWLGEVSRARARRILARSRLLVLSSRLEGGANVISEALVEEVPVLASRISGSVGLLGARYPGYYPVGDTEALARLLYKAETDAAFYASLARWCQRLRPMVEPARESAAWQRLLRELVPQPLRGTG
jgi:putative glycosyltransferase (TIGR04348 family)